MSAARGGFDALVLGLLGELETEYPHIGYGVVTYITHPWGGAAQFAQKALRQNKQVINLAQ